MLEVFKKYSEMTRVVHIPLCDIKPNPNQPRKYFDSISLEELSASIEEFGVIQPITVRKVRYGYEIIAGERRFRAAENIGMETIPAIVMNADTEKSALLALLENLQREDLCFFEIAEGYQKLIREQGMTQDDLARKLGKSQSTIANKLRLLRLSPRVKKMIRDFSLSERHARALLNLKDEGQQLMAVKTICQQHMNVQQSEELIKHMLTEKPKTNQKIKISAFRDIRMFTNTVRQALDLMRESGVDAEMEQKEYDWGVEYVIKVKNDQND